MKHLLRLLPPWLVVLAVAVLAGCAAQPVTGDSGGEIRTASDQSDAERRARLRLELASAYFGRGQATTALDEVKLALAAKPDLPEALSLRGLIYASLGEPKLAEESFQRALQLRPRDAGVLHNYGWFLCQNRRFEDAETQFALALGQTQYADLSRLLLAQGVCHARAGRWAEAERAIAHAYEIDPANPTTAYNLAEVLYRRGAFERARFYIRRVNDVPDFVNAQSLWLAARIEKRIGTGSGVEEFARPLRERFPESPEAANLLRGRFDD